MSSAPATAKQEVRIWVDGCFDLFHFGHANLLRKAKACGDKLVVGVHTDEEIERNKGPTVMKNEERYEAVLACKWVDEVVLGAPYDTYVETLDRHNCHICVHGDDISTNALGQNSYQAIIDAGRFRTVTRTTGVSTTDIVSRLLDTTPAPTPSPSSTPLQRSPYTGVSRYMPDTTRLTQFAQPVRTPEPHERIVYIDGSFDLFHLGHIHVLKQARQLGDYLIVGCHPDDVVKRLYGEKYPIMALHERVLSLLACRYVDNVILGAPFMITEGMIQNLKISVVVRGSRPDYQLPTDQSDPYEAAKRLGIYREVPSHPTLTNDVIRQRIIDDRRLYEERNRKKEQKELKVIAAHSPSAPPK